MHGSLVGGGSVGRVAVRVVADFKFGRKYAPEIFSRDDKRRI